MKTKAHFNTAPAIKRITTVKNRTDKGKFCKPYKTVEAELTGSTPVVCGDHKPGYNGRDVIRQRSQKIKWTRDVRDRMQARLENRETRQREREEVQVQLLELSELMD